MIQSSNASVLQKIGLPTCVHDYAFSSRRLLVADAEPAADRRAGGWVAPGAGAGTCLAPAGSGALRELLLVHGVRRGAGGLILPGHCVLQPLPLATRGCGRPAGLYG